EKEEGDRETARCRGELRAHTRQIYRDVHDPTNKQGQNQDGRFDAQAVRRLLERSGGRSACGPVPLPAQITSSSPRITWIRSQTTCSSVSCVSWMRWMLKLGTVKQKSQNSGRRAPSRPEKPTVSIPISRPAWRAR